MYKTRYLILIAVSLLYISCGTTVKPPTPVTPEASPIQRLTPTPRPTPKPLTWQTINLFQHVSQTQPSADTVTTDAFTVPTHWRIEWFCDTASYGNTSYNVIGDVYNADGSPATSATSLNILCGSDGIHGFVEEQSAGTFRLQILSEWRWIIGIQVPK